MEQGWPVVSKGEQVSASCVSQTHLPILRPLELTLSETNRDKS